MNSIRIGTRGSRLAVWQAEHVAQLISRLHPGLEIELRHVKTEGDKRTDVPLLEIGGKNLFVKELEMALLDGRVDIAVHSMKDVTVNVAPEFDIPVFVERDDPSDAFVSNKFNSVWDLPRGAKVGTCSLRRQSQLLAMRNDLIVAPLRGNVVTRLSKLDEGRYDAIILASAGLKRLGLDERIAESMPLKQFIPSPGQGAMGIECRSCDNDIRELIAPLNHFSTWIAVGAERKVNRRLGGSCHAPLGVYASKKNGDIYMLASLALPDGNRQIFETASGSAENSEFVADMLADSLIEHGAEEIIKCCEVSSNG